MERRNTPKLAAVSLSLALVLAAFPVMAGDDAWSIAGIPPGGDVQYVLVNPAVPSTLYVAAGQGIYKSTDSGATWTPIFRIINSAVDMVIDPLSPDRLYVAEGGDQQKTLFRTDDGGGTWTEADNGIAHNITGGLDGVWTLALDPVTDGVAYASTANTGLYKTTDYGAHWTSIGGTVIAPLVFFGSLMTEIIIDPTDPDIVYVKDDVSTATGSVAGLYKSTDAGADWAPTSWVGSNLGTVTLDPANHLHLVACSYSNPTILPFTGTKLVSSPDSGVTWSAGADCPYSNVVRIDPSDSQHILMGGYATGLYQATAGSPIPAAVGDFGTDGIMDIAFDPATPDNIYVGTLGWGLYKSTDGGSTWTTADVGIGNVQVNSMVEGADEVLYLASAGSGVFRSTDEGADWTQIGTGLVGISDLSDISANALVEDPTNPAILYVGTSNSLYTSTDNGDHWSLSDTGMPANPGVNALAVDATPSTLYAGMMYGDGVYVSVDSGATWTSASAGIDPGAMAQMMALAADPQHSGVAYLGTWDTGLYKTTDGGAHWVLSSRGLPSGHGVWAIAIDPTQTNTVYASDTDGGIYKSTDAGATWTTSDARLGGYVMTSIQIDPSDPSIIYASENYSVGYSGPGAPYISTDGGTTWTELAGPSTATAAAVQTRAVRRPVAKTSSADTLPIAIGKVVIDPKHPDRLFASGDDGRIYTYSNTPASSGSTGSSGSGGKSDGGSTAPPSGSGGGGDFSVLLLFGLAGFAARRKR